MEKVVKMDRDMTKVKKRVLQKEIPHLLLFLKHILTI